MAMDAFFERNYVWQVYFEEIGPLAEITLSFRRARADGSGVEFDEDPQIITERVLDVINGEDDQLVMDGFLALIPDGQLLSCSLRVLRHRLLILEFEDYDHSFAGYDKQVVKNTFEGRLFNTDGSNADLLFIGGERTAHETATIKHWSKVIESRALRASADTIAAAWEPVLNVYEAVIYTLSTEIHMVTRNNHAPISRIQPALADVAARYGFVLPPQ
ncbi:MAG TPA: hypothetical protein VGD58_29350 [Herpetosiphonaceae bacterium]